MPIPLLLSLLLLPAPQSPEALEPPNLVVILADDLGYGDLGANNPDSAIPTPRLDAIAAGGVRFTDAHSGSAVCTPTRYGLMTGRYCWRSRLKGGVLNGYSGHLIEPDRPTVASVLKARGYHTACIGKWHLGMDLPRRDKVMDWQGKIEDGPLANGFDHFFGVTASLDFPPYVWVEDDRFTEPGAERYPGSGFPAYLRAGEWAPGFDHQGALDEITRRAVAHIRERAAAGGPFFLYLPLTAPHKPVLPAERFRGKSGVGPYGDFVMQVDWTVGEVDRALEEAGVADDTLLLVTSDNGSFMYHLDAPESPQRAKQGADGDATLDHAADPKVHGYLSATHRANGPLRGTKADVWDGGHRVPFLARWPAAAPAGAVCDRSVSLVDLMATFADAAGAAVPAGAAEDSTSLLPLLRDPAATSWERPPVVMHSANGTFAVRDGRWKLILGSGSGGRGLPKGPKERPPFQLYDMEADLGERVNLAATQPGVAARLRRQLEQLRAGALPAKAAAAAPPLPPARPNVLLVLADDMGWSDLGCYGGEIATPTLDVLAAEGVRFTQFHNTAKCFPSRACLLTGLYAQQVGMGRRHTEPLRNAATLGEVLRAAGYRTLMSGKHHGVDNPHDRGFDRYRGLRDGAANHFNPGHPRAGEPAPAQKRPGERVWCFDEEVVQPYTPEDPDFYSTDAYTDWAIEFLREERPPGQPFFLYLAYQAPHDPLQAWPEDIARYRGRYGQGYGAVAAARDARQRGMGLIEERYPRSEPTHRPWAELSEAERDDQDLRMAVYAAMIDRMDRNLGRLLAVLEQRGDRDNTIVLFASDNGCSAEVVEIGDGAVGAIDRWSSLGRDWANVSNTPFRLFKNYSHEGGINTPLIVSWPAAGLEGGRVSGRVGHFIDFMPTLLELAEADYPTAVGDEPVLPLNGESLLPAILGDDQPRRSQLFWSWSKGRAVRDGDWKAVSWNGAWELYDLSADATETRDLAAEHPERLADLVAAHAAWLERCRAADG